MIAPSRFPEYDVPGMTQHHFNPYESNGGSIAAIAGDDFAVVGADTRLSIGYSIHTRNQNKIFKLTNQSVLASAGCWPDSIACSSSLKYRMQAYEHVHNKTMSTTAIAQMISIMMYNRRFFPYYVSNVLVGLDTEGKGCVYSYDPVGHCQRTTYQAGGSSGALLQPLLDNQVEFKNQVGGSEKPPITKEKAIDMIHDLFVSAAERDIYTGDSVTISVITKDGVEELSFPLRRD